MTAFPQPKLRLALDRDALASNWTALDRMSGSARAGAAVKADCYGLGVDACVPALREAGCRDWFVAHWIEVPALLKHVAPEQISVLHGPLDADDAAYARATGVRPIIVSLEQARLWLESGGGPCHLMVDTGINRLGISPREVGDPLVARLDVQTLISHLASADEDSPQNAQQLAAFCAAIPRVEHREASLCNSAGIALGADYHFDLTRPGLALYGGLPRAEFAGIIRSVATPQAALLQTRVLGTGDHVGYNATFTAPRPMKVGVVSVGYADGILRAWGGASFAHQGRALAILGKVSMDMIVIDLSLAEDLQAGDWVELPYDLPHAAQQTGLSQYELLTLLGDRFAR